MTVKIAIKWFNLNTPDLDHQTFRLQANEIFRVFSGRLSTPLNARDQFRFVFPGITKLSAWLALVEM